MTPPLVLPSRDQAVLPTPWRVLFLCTGNSARSQIAEALLIRKGRGRFVVESAGTRPAAAVNPHALAALAAHGIDWAGRLPRGLEAVQARDWDLIITVCDRAKESCPIFPGEPIVAHWGMPDPAELSGDEAAIRRAFEDTIALLSRRIDLLLALPEQKLELLMLAHRVRAIGHEALPTSAPSPTTTTP